MKQKTKSLKIVTCRDKTFKSKVYGVRPSWTIARGAPDAVLMPVPQGLFRELAKAAIAEKSDVQDFIWLKLARAVNDFREGKLK